MKIYNSAFLFTFSNLKFKIIIPHFNKNISKKMSTEIYDLKLIERGKKIAAFRAVDENIDDVSLLKINFFSRYKV